MAICSLGSRKTIFYCLVFIVVLLISTHVVFQKKWFSSDFFSIPNDKSEEFQSWLAKQNINPLTLAIADNQGVTFRVHEVVGDSVETKVTCTVTSQDSSDVYLNSISDMHFSFNDRIFSKDYSLSSLIKFSVH